MTLGSLTAYVNDKSVKLDIAPRRVTYVNANKTKILIPSRFVSESLGYTFVWNNTISNIGLLSPLKLYYDDSWKVYKGTKANVSYNGKKIDVSDMPGIVINNVTLLQAKKVFNDGLGAKYTYNKATNTVTFIKDKNTITMTLGSTTAVVNNKTYTMDTAAYSIKNNLNGKSYIMVPGSFVAKHLGYSYNWDSKSKTAVIKKVDASGSTKTAVKTYLNWTSNLNSIDGTEYTNLIKKVNAYYKNNTDIVTIEGLSLPNATIVQNNDLSCLYIDVPKTYHSFGDKSKTITNGYCLKGVAISSVDETTTRITIQITENTEYYTSTSGNTLTLFLVKYYSETY
jgi:N-acetylmuramoyl-L-alanine amidase